LNDVLSAVLSAALNGPQIDAWSGAWIRALSDPWLDAQLGLRLEA
jgi:hypothetical protein